jgi:hypothetical protein
VLISPTPNAIGLGEHRDLLANVEVNHPDHVVSYTCRTLGALLTRHRWEPFEHEVYIQDVKSSGTVPAVACSRPAPAWCWASNGCWPGWPPTRPGPDRGSRPVSARPTPADARPQPARPRRRVQPFLDLLPQQLVLLGEEAGGPEPGELHEKCSTRISRKLSASSMNVAGG